MALGGIFLICRFTFASDVIDAPFGSWISIAFLVRVRVCRCFGTSRWLKKCPVLPVSAMVLMMLEGGPTIKLVLLATKFVFVFNSVLFALFAILLFLSIEGSPRPHVDAGGRGARIGRT